MKEKTGYGASGVGRWYPWSRRGWERAWGILKEEVRRTKVITNKPFNIY